MILVIVGLCILSYKINKFPPVSSFKFNFNSYEKLILIIAILLPVLALLGTNMMKYGQNNILLFVMLILALISVIIVSLTHKNIRNEMYPVVIFSIALSILISYALISTYIYGTDSQKEFYLFNLIFNSGQWKLFNMDTLNACLSISLLPSLYQLLMGMNSIYLFKLIYVLPLSLTPLAIYIISKKYIGSFYGFLAAVFFLSQYAFYDQVSAYRNYVAILFFALIIMVLMHNKISDPKKKLLSILFIVSMILSHYSTTYIFLFIFAFAMIIIYLSGLLKRNPFNFFKTSIKDYNFFSTNLSVGLLILTFCIMFLWYGQITSTTFNTGLLFVNETLKNLIHFYDLESRDPTLMEAFGSTLKNAMIIKYINFITHWISLIFIAIGIFTTLFKYFKVNGLNKKFKNIDAWYGMDYEFFAFALSCAVILVISIVIPFVFVHYSLDRATYQMMIILSPFFVIGGASVFKFFKIKKADLIILILILLLLVNSMGVLSQVLNPLPYKSSILLNSPLQINNTYYINDQDAYGATWLKNYGKNDIKVYSDYSGQYSLISNAMINFNNIDKNTITQKNPYFEGYIYLTHINTIKNRLYQWKDTSRWVEYNLDEFEGNLNRNDLIYDNGESKMYGNSLFLT